MSAVRAVVEHARRLEILDCLDGRGPTTIAELEHGLGHPPDRLRYHVGRLDAHGIVLRCGVERGTTGVERRYAMRLNDQPEWVRKAVETHRRGKD